jgi:hypothetical protein
MERDRFDEIRDQVNVVFESLRGDIRLLAEGHVHVVEAIDELRAGQRRLETGLEGLRIELLADRSELAQFRAETKDEFRKVRTETRDEFRAVRTHVTAVKRQVRALGQRRPRT